MSLRRIVGEIKAAWSWASELRLSQLESLFTSPCRTRSFFPLYINLNQRNELSAEEDHGSSQSSYSLNEF